MGFERIATWTIAAVLTGASVPALGAEPTQIADEYAEANELILDPMVEVRPFLEGHPEDPRRGGVGRWGPQAGDWEFTLTGVASNNEDFDEGSFGLDVSLGYYFTRDVSAEIRQGIQFVDFGESQWAGSTRGAVDYHFDLDRLRPFVGLSLGGFYGDNVDETGSFGVEGGAKWYAKPDTFLFGRMEIHWLFDGGDSDAQILYIVGIGFNF
ncbi:MAG: hypothetical protein WD294_13855 [Phycisphaeraceae bacterium]